MPGGRVDSKEGGMGEEHNPIIHGKRKGTLQQGNSTLVPGLLNQRN
jgi:hypothetical protein